MLQRITHHLNWKLPLYMTIGASVLLLALFVISANASLIYALFIAPILCLTLITLLIVAAVSRKPRPFFRVLLTIAAVIACSWLLLKNEATLRPQLRWLLWSNRFKAAVLAQANPARGQFRHIEWDGWGGAPVGDWTSYVVFDPTDSLAAAFNSHLPGKFKGIPCDVDEVRRLETHWYSVTLSMNEWWEQCE